MRVSCVMYAEEIENTLLSWFPLELVLEPGENPRRVLTLRDFKRFEMVPGEGIRFACRGRLEWTMGPLEPSLTIHRIVVRIGLSLDDIADVANDQGVVLRLRPTFEEVDVAGVPSLIDRGVARLVQARLDERVPSITWRISQTLAWKTTLPPRLRTSESLGFGIFDAVLDISAEALRIDGAAGLVVTPSERGRDVSPRQREPERD